MTKLTKVIKRLTDVRAEEKASAGMLCVSLLPGDDERAPSVRIWQYGCSHGYTLTIRELYGLMAQVEGERQATEKCTRAIANHARRSVKRFGLV